ncbi:flavin reductase family protein [Pontibacillus litoralis]|uniref:Flavin reductase n=1 Tax=Pontibacillus litoralis JSM 072002 TaxID=1385512 RepID=A0A0A5G3D2_9BACI|nr:flavin reductase family protein [Pontibacillus litoralis]KGX85585.1 flavin reductase [Pontibacillus litoralis JSM 072002]
MDDRLFKTAMSKFATGVTVITTEVNGEVHGMTANAFMSVSLDPKLIVVSVAHKARMHDYLKQSDSFAVTILSEAQQHLSTYFAGKRKEDQSVAFDRFEQLPILKDAVVNIVCSQYANHVAGDHTLFIGEVSNIQLSDQAPLAYFSGKYGTVQIAE